MRPSLILFISVGILSIFVQTRRILLHYAGDTVDIYCIKAAQCMLLCNEHNEKYCYMIDTTQRKHNGTHWYITIEDVSEENVGVYTCFRLQQASCYGPVSDGDQLLLIYTMEAAVIYPRDDPVIVSEGNELRVNFSVKSIPSVNITLTWLTPRGDIVILDSQQDELVFENTTCSDTSVYRCMVENHKLRLTLIKQFNVSVLCSPRRDTKKEYNSTVVFELGESFSLQASFIANPAPHFVWTKNKDGTPTELPSSGRFTQIHTMYSSTLQVATSNPEDAGSYLLIVSNSIGEDATLVFTVKVKEQEEPLPQEDSVLFISIGSGAFIGIVVIVVVIIGVRKCRQQNNNKGNTSSKPKSIKELAKPQRPKEAGESRYSSREQMKGENYDEIVPDGGLYQQEMYKDLGSDKQVYYNE